MGCKGERPLPVEGILGGKGLVERGRAGGRVVAFLAPQPKPVTCLKRPAFDQTCPAGQSRYAGLDQDAVHMDTAETGAETVVADHHHGRSSLLSQITELADRVVQSPDHLGGRIVPFGTIDARFVNIQVPPDAVLKRVEVLKLNH